MIAGSDTDSEMDIPDSVSKYTHYWAPLRPDNDRLRVFTVDKRKQVRSLDSILEGSFTRD